MKKLETVQQLQLSWPGPLPKKALRLFPREQIPRRLGKVGLKNKFDFVLPELHAFKQCFCGENFTEKKDCT